MTDPARLVLAAVRLDREDPEEAGAGALAALEEGVGGFVLFGGTCEEVRALTGRLRSTADRPLWIAADLERGAGQQFRGAAALPPPAALASHPSAEEAVRLAGRLTALEARALGVNWALAPVLDLDVEPRNPIVGTRSFGADPERVARLGKVWMEACQDSGVAACAKHFPGHGRTTTDSHVELPRVDAPRERLEEDLLPFRAVAGEVAGVMTAHVAYPGLGCEGPATLSPGVLGTLLRGELGFRGLVVTDALVMAGLGGAGETGAATEGWRAVRALRAGCDLLLYPSDPALTARTLRQAAASDSDLAVRVEGASARSEEVLARFDAAAPGAASAGSATRSPGSAAQASLPELPLFRPDAPGLTSLAAACVRPQAPGGEAEAEAGVDRWLDAAGGRARVVAVRDDPGGPAEPPGRALVEELDRRGWRAELRGSEPMGGPLLVLVEATPRAWKGRAGLSDEARRRLRELLEAGDPAYPVVLGHPRILSAEGLTGLCAWSSEPVMERGAAAWLADRAAGAAG